MGLLPLWRVAMSTEEAIREPSPKCPRTIIWSILRWRSHAETAMKRATGLNARTKGADVGTGVAYMLPYLSHAVGPAGGFYAEDIALDFLDKPRGAPPPQV